MSLFPLPSIETPPSTWPAMVVYAATVLLEAEGEPPPGPLAVAYVIRTRVMAHRDLSNEPSDTILTAVCLAPQQFSCWNPEGAGMRRARLTGIDPRRWELAWQAACGAWWAQQPNPAPGADHYMNPILTRAGRPLHDLPRWYDPAKVVATIGAHEFLALG